MVSGRRQLAIVTIRDSLTSRRMSLPPKAPVIGGIGVLFPRCNYRAGLLAVLVNPIFGIPIACTSITPAPRRRGTLRACHRNLRPILRISEHRRKGYQERIRRQDGGHGAHWARTGNVRTRRHSAPHYREREVEMDKGDVIYRPDGRDKNIRNRFHLRPTFVRVNLHFLVE